MEELVIQRHWEHTASNNAGIQRKDRIITSVIMVLLLSFAILFAGYCIRKVHSYLYPKYSLEWQCQIPQIPASMPIYEVTPLSSKGYLEQNLEVAERIGAEYNHIICTNKRGIYIDTDRENGVHLLLQNHSNGEYRYHTQKPIWTGWKRADRREMEEALSFYSIEIPANAQFRVNGNGWHTFIVEPYFSDGTMITGEVRCRYAGDGFVTALDNSLTEYTISEFRPVVNANTVRSELASGKYYRNMGFDNRESLQILSARIIYARSANGSCVPHCCFQIQQGSDTEFEEIMIPLLADR